MMSKNRVKKKKGKKNDIDDEVNKQTWTEWITGFIREYKCIILFYSVTSVRCYPTVVSISSLSCITSFYEMVFNFIIWITINLSIHVEKITNLITPPATYSIYLFLFIDSRTFKKFLYAEEKNIPNTLNPYAYISLYTQLFKKV